MQITKKRSLELFSWIFFFSIAATINATSVIMEAKRGGDELAIWEPFLWEFSSVGIILLLIPVILYIDQRIPIASEKWVKRLLTHLPLSMGFSLLHISGMVAIRKLVYALVGAHYKYDDIGWALLYEYRKDLATYILIMFTIYAYREIMRLRQGEAQLSQMDDAQDEGRILVSKRGHFHFIDPRAIHWVEAAGNYVELKVGPETYMLRATMKEIEARLGTSDFARIHRSTIINRGQVDHITAGMNGDKVITLKNKQEFRLSRRYRQNVDF